MSNEIVPKGYKKLEIAQPHIETLGPGYYKREEDGQLVFAFYVKPENCNQAGSAHGGMLMAIADYTLATTIMEGPRNPVATISFHSEFIAPAKVGELLEVKAIRTKLGTSLGFSEGKIKVGTKIIMNFGGVIKKMDKK
ncbi:MAG: PaaI family thioesterase [SAR86 cluster bacterium]|jgi:acyl-coenzyme A thioesterase 13|nr:PaaI family thioesterase [SAR86 cluster bacterium]|tara:strand:+ start:2775 stop:3188 length:414 start_codon:yes stop_codon:yes gene_type:complete